jgi:hypothetical protein
MLLAGLLSFTADALRVCGRQGLVRKGGYHGPVSRLSGRVAKKEDETTKSQTESEFMNIPYEGLVGAEQGGLFATPLNMFDPIKDTDNLPGEDGSDEKIAAIQQRIQQRVAKLKKTGEWGDDGEEYGKDPLAKMPIYETMIMQLRTCKPFESFSELGLTFVLMLTTTVLLSAYLLFMRDSFDVFIVWYTRTDFSDSELFSNLFRSITGNN